MQTLRLFLKRPTTWSGFAAALLFQLIFSVVWMTGYDGVTDRTDRLRVGIVNEDQGLGVQVAERLRAMLPTETEMPADLSAAERMLNERELHMVIRIPATFTADVAAPDKTARIEYRLNESNPAMIKNIMTGIASQVTAAVNKMAVDQGVRAALAQAGIPAEQAAGLSASLSERVTAHVQSTHPVQGMNNQMVPMMLVLASYVGAMIMSMNMEQSSLSVSSLAGRWERFAARGLINVAASVLVSLAGSSLVLALGGQAEQGFWPLWGIQCLIVLAFLFVSQLFLLLFGMGGMVFNILMLSAQLVSSGAMVPRELLPEFYAGLSRALPATYAVDGVMNVIFGGPGIGPEIAGLVTAAVAAILLGALAVAVKRGRRSDVAAAPAAADR